MPQVIIGIDIGVTGAIAVIRGSTLHDIEDMPAVARGKGKAKVSNEINPAGLADYLRLTMSAQDVDPNDMLAVFERVNAMPGQGSSSGFSLGDSSGCVRAVMATLRIPTQIITPAEWKKHFRIQAAGPARRGKGETFTATQDAQRKRERAAAKGEAKEQARALVIQLYPGMASSLTRKADHNRAEAVLIARYGYEVLT